MDVLTALSAKHIPGLSGKETRSSLQSLTNVNMLDNDQVRLLLNKKMYSYAKGTKLIRVFMYENSDETGVAQMYKTVGTQDGMTVRQVIDVVRRKFKIDGGRWKLAVIVNAEEVFCSPDADIHELVMVYGKQISADLDFVLRPDLSPIKAGSVEDMMNEFSDSPKMGLTLDIDLAQEITPFGNVRNTKPDSVALRQKQRVPLPEFPLPENARNLNAGLPMEDVSKQPFVLRPQRSSSLVTNSAKQRLQEMSNNELSILPATSGIAVRRPSDPSLNLSSERLGATSSQHNEGSSLLPTAPPRPSNDPDKSWKPQTLKDVSAQIKDSSSDLNPRGVLKVSDSFGSKSSLVSIPDDECSKNGSDGQQIPLSSDMSALSSQKSQAFYAPSPADKKQSASFLKNSVSSSHKKGPVIAVKPNALVAAQPSQPQSKQIPESQLTRRSVSLDNLKNSFSNGNLKSLLTSSSIEAVTSKENKTAMPESRSLSASSFASNVFAAAPPSIVPSAVAYPSADYRPSQSVQRDPSPTAIALLNMEHMIEHMINGKVPSSNSLAPPVAENTKRKPLSVTNSSEDMTKGSFGSITTLVTSITSTSVPMKDVYDSIEKDISDSLIDVLKSRKLLISGKEATGIKATKSIENLSRTSSVLLEMERVCRVNI